MIVKMCAFLPDGGDIILNKIVLKLLFVKHENQNQLGVFIHVNIFLGS